MSSTLYYFLDTGKPFQVISGHANNQELMEGLGFIKIDDDIPLHGAYVENEALCFCQEGKPSEQHIFNYATKQWEDPRTLDDLKAAQWTQIKQAREAAINAPLETPYGTVDSGPDDRGNITDAVMLLQTMESLGTPITIDFTMFDNTPITLTTAQMVYIGLLLGQKVQAAYVRSQARRAAIDAATTKEEVATVVW